MAAKNSKYFIDCDFDGDWYLIPKSEKKEWRKSLKKTNDGTKPMVTPADIIFIGNDLTKLEIKSCKLRLGL